MTHEIPGHPSKNGESGAYPCKGKQLVGGGNSPSNKYHPSQKAWLVENNLYTGRMIADIGHLPIHLKDL